MKRVIFHIDVNSAFLSWEAVYRLYHLGGRLDLREVPSIVGGDQEKRHGIVLAKSIPSKKYGIQTGESVLEAKQKCPELIIVPPNYTLYNRSSRAFINILANYTDKIEQYSIDEAFVDMTGRMEDPLKLAYEIRDRIRTELGFTVNVGVSNSKLLAKMASDFTKPNRVHTLWPEEVKEKMWPLPVGDLFYVGYATKRKLAAAGVHTIGDLAKLDERYLWATMKSHGLLVKQYANGIDHSEVVTEPPLAKGYGNSLTTPRDVYEADLAKQYLLSLAETVSARLRADGAKIRCVSISIRDYNLLFYGHQKVLRTATDLTSEIYEASCQLFNELWNGLPVRHLGIHTSQVTREDSRQLSLFDTVDYEKLKKAELAVDRLRRKFGRDVIKRACFLERKDGSVAPDNMAGGISREKLTVDYSKEPII